MPSILSLSGDSVSIDPFEDFSRMSFEQCAKNIYLISRSSLRGYAKNNEIFRDLARKEEDEAIRGKIASLRSIVPTLVRIGTVVCSALNVCVSVSPQAAKHTFDWISDRCPRIPSDFLSSRFRTRLGAFDFEKFEQSLTKNISTAEGLLQKYSEISRNFEEADRFELDSVANRAKELAERRTREAGDRRDESAELFRLIQQLNKEVSDSIRAIARG